LISNADKKSVHSGDPSRIEDRINLFTSEAVANIGEYDLLKDLVRHNRFI